MSIFSETLKAATKEECNARWSCGKPGELFRCGFCGHKFKEGDMYRGIYTNGTPGAHGNPLVCEKCNDSTGALIAMWKHMHEDVRKYKERYWWFFTHREQ